MIDCNTGLNGCAEETGKPASVGKSQGKVDEQELKGLSAYERFTKMLAEKARRLERELERKNEVFLEEARQRLKKMHVESTLIRRDSADYIGKKSIAADVIGNLAINLENLNAVQFYSDSATGDGYSSHGYTYYCLDYILRADMHWLERERGRLEAYAKLKWQGSIFQPDQRKLLDVRWIAGEWGITSLLDRLFRAARNSPLTDALDSDMTVRDSLMQEFRSPWVQRQPGLVQYSYRQGIEITVDVANVCIRIRIPRWTFIKEDLLEVLSSRGLIEIADRIAYHLRPR